MGEEYHIRGAPRIPPFVVVVSVCLHASAAPARGERLAVAPPGGGQTGLNVNADEGL